MKRRNVVILDGPLSIEESKLVEVNGREVVAALCWIETDRPALGGRHRVVAYGQLAQEVVAFAQTAGGGRVDTTVDGWLRTINGSSMVVADRLSFHVSPAVLREARQRLRESA